MRAFVRKLEVEKQVPPSAAAALLQLTPATYVGHAPQLARDVRGAINAMWAKDGLAPLPAK
jgi:hypothetical protein